MHLVDALMVEAGEKNILHANRNHRIFPGGSISPCSSEGMNQFSNELAIEKIDKLDLSMVKMKLCLALEDEGRGWTHDRAEVIELWYKRFLKLCVMCGEEIVPTKLIDEMWHAHILDTRKYHEDCQEIFGHYLHHFPYFGVRGEEDRRNEEKSFQRTRALFEEFFGESPICGVKDGSACQGGDGNGNCSFRQDL